MRIAFSVLLLISILFLPFWLSVILALFGMAYFSFFVEGVALLFLSDLLHATKEARLHSMIFVSLIISVIFLIGSEMLKKKLKFHAR